MSLDDLYQEIILDHGRRPRNFGELDERTHEAEGFNPLCGDEVRVHVLLNGDRIEDIRFSGRGCAISTASASMMTQVIKGKTVEQAFELFDQFRKAVTSDSDGEADLGELDCLTGVRRFPTRVKCATLAWHAMKTALAGGGKTTTE